MTLSPPSQPSLLPIPKIKDVKNEKPLSEEKGSKKGHVSTRRLEQKRN